MELAVHFIHRLWRKQRLHARFILFVFYAVQN